MTSSAILVENLESRILLTTAFGLSQITVLPNRGWEYGPSNITPYRDGALFDATNPITRRQAIWISNGTRAGTHPLNIRKHGDKLLVGVVGNEIFYAVPPSPLTANYFDPSPSFDFISSELYVTSNLGRTSIDLGPISPDVNWRSSLAVGSELYFMASSGFWVSDGTRAGTREVFSSNIGEVHLTPFGNEILIGSFAGGSLSVFNPATLDQQVISTDALSPAVFNGRIFFASNLGPQATGTSLWSSDGTAAGTIDLYADAGSRNVPTGIEVLAVAGNRLLLSDRSTLYQCDGSLNSIEPIAIPGDLLAATSFAGGAVFGASDSSIWNSDGTAAGTSRILQNTPSYGGLYIGYVSTNYELVPAGGILFGTTGDTWSFAATDLVDGTYIQTGTGQLFVYAKSGPPAPVLSVTALNSTLTSAIEKSIVNDTVTIQISNTGDASSTGRYAIDLDLSADGVTTSAKLATRLVQLAIKPGESRKIVIPIRRIPKLAAGSYQLIAQLLGPHDVFAEGTLIGAIDISSPP